MSERTKELGKFADTMYAHSLCIESMYASLFSGVFAPNSWKTKMAAPGPLYVTWQVGTIRPMDLVFLSTFNDQSMNIG